MRTISSFRFVGVFAPPTNVPTPLPILLFGAGKMPALSKAVAFGLIMRDGMTLPGKAAPCTIPKGATPPGQLANRTDGCTLQLFGSRGLTQEGTTIADETELKFPP